ncbi:uncharacterized protein MELLADRAFT_71537 [Melampsora larici-populina 98AG31]|uniref:Uncharacterized protein n=1 Tax=Melampsora larici-populina (strain 98AG31 / pathotype 3-4-7) TaxID=747676 RepID=F4RHL3_MELLP|nr:uncharacterized protein MELLADRAFT_71537 [Melampsora larici-populina 98AG31]EGG07849.1 hypothetical protein MELLADRAFT_71537 [Melampsora larici-populina 98AG31]
MSSTSSTGYSEVNTSSLPEVTWLPIMSGSRMIFNGFIPARTYFEHRAQWEPLPLAQVGFEATDHIDPQLLVNTTNTTPDNEVNNEAHDAVDQEIEVGDVMDINSSPRAQRYIRRNSNQSVRNANVIDLTLSPRVRREIERLEQYHRTRGVKQEMRRIIKVVQDKRRSEFRLLREALGEVYAYSGPYLEKTGDKEAAAELIRGGALGAEFVQDFDNDAKWAWLQIRVNASRDSF